MCWEGILPYLDIFGIFWYILVYFGIFWYSFFPSVGIAFFHVFSTFAGKKEKLPLQVSSICHGRRDPTRTSSMWTLPMCTASPHGGDFGSPGRSRADAGQLDVVPLVSVPVQGSALELVLYF